MNDVSLFYVTEKAKRPASPDNCCFYCKEPVGKYHKRNCVLIHKKVKVRLAIQYKVEVPHFWTGDDVEFHRNKSSWCQGNCISELERLDKQNGCLCNLAHFKYIEDISGAYLDEK